ncbi:MAG: hypothetical protein ABSG14_04480 [Verrucomicrobiia bacterium]
MYDANGQTNDIQIWNYGTLLYTGPVDVSSTLQRIRDNDCLWLTESDDGGFFNFYPDELPNIPRMGNNYYMEFMVWPFMDLTDGTYDTVSEAYGSMVYPGAMRLLIGLGGEVYFTGDHYGEDGNPRNAYYVNPLPGAASGDSWVNTASDKWEAGPNWSYGYAPSSGDPADLITNANTKTVTIDAATVLNNAENVATNPVIGCMTIYNLTVSAPPGSINTLALTNAGTATPLQVLSSLTLDTNGALVVNNSAIVATNGQLFVGNTGGSAVLTITNGGSVAATNVVVGFANSASNNVLIVSGANLFVNGPLVVSQAGGTGTLTFNGGTITVNQLVLTNGGYSVFTYNAGTLTSSGTWVTNNQLFAVGDGTDAATFQLVAGSVHSFADNLEIRSNAFLTGCGTINGNIVVDSGGTVLANCGETLTFMGIVTNNGAMQVINGSVLEGYGPVVNNGLIVICNGNTNFHSTFVNNGTILTVPTAGNNGPICAGSTLTLSTPTVPGATYSWTGPGSFNSTQQNPSIANATTAASGTYNVTVTVNGCTSAAGSTIATVYAIPATPTAGNNGPICAGGTLTLSTPTVAGATYSWTGPNSFSSSAQNPSIANATTAASGTYSVTLTVNGCTSAAGSTIATVNAVPGTPGTITQGNPTGSSVCANASGVTYTISSVSGATSYTWSVPSGASIASGQGTTSITVNWGATSGNVTVTPSNGSCNGTASSLAVTVTGVGAAGPISGPTSVAAGTNGVTYSISSVSGATSYTWSVPSGASIASGQGTTSITVNWGATSGDVTVTPSNANGCSGTAANLLVTVTDATNSWTDGNDKWENSSNWSRANAPSVSDSIDLITNAATKAVTIDATTVLSNTVNACMTISNLYVAGTANSANTLFLNNAGTSTPLRVIGTELTLDTNAALSVNNSAVLATNLGLIVGNTGGKVSVTITNGGQVVSGYGWLGFASSSSNNVVLVTGAGSVWNNDNGYMHIGWYSAGNQLIITNAGQVVGLSAYLGYYYSSSNNLALVTGPGSVWTAGGMCVGNYGSGNQLIITNGGQVVDGLAYLGYGDNVYHSSNNVVLVTGSGSVWSNSGNLYVGNYGSSNQLTIANGGKVVVVNASAYLGFFPGSDNNVVLVTGPGSVWSNQPNLYIGWYSAGNQLIITNGGQVFDGAAELGINSSGSNNVVLVTGPGSVWSNGDVTVGAQGAGTQLTIANGGQVVDGNGYLGSFTSASSNNVALVTGSGSVWSNTGSLYVGYASTGNRVTVTNGGAVSANQLVLGQNASSSGTLTLAGGTVTVVGLIATNSGSAIAFNSGTLISNGTAITNAQTFVVGDALDAATFQLNGGVHSFANGLEIRNNASLTGCGTVNGNVVVDPGGTVLATCAGTLSFTSIVTNNGAIVVANGTTMNFYGPVVNNGVINATNGTVQYFSTVCPVTITTSSSPSGGGTTSGGGTVNCGSNVTVTATAGNCYGFVNWTEGGTQLTASASFSFTASVNRSLTANFTPITYTISTSSSPSGGGSTSGGGTVNCGSNAMVCATANSGYVFANWTLNSSVVSASNCYTFTPSANENLVANFAPFQITALTLQGSNVLVNWIAPQGSTNAVQATSGGTGGSYSTNFLPVSPLIVLLGANPASGFSTNYLDIGGATNTPARYYRIAIGNVTGVVVTQSFDNTAQPAYSGGWTNGSNGGTGFGPWTLTTTIANINSNGFFIGSSTNNALGTSPGIDVSGNSWGVYANSGAAAAAYRSFSNSVPVGGTFKIDMDNGFIGSDDSDGFVLRTGNATNDPGAYNTNARFEFLYIGNDPINSYKVVDNAGLYNIGVGFTGTGLHLIFTLTSKDTYTLLVIDNASGNTNATVNGTLGGTPGNTLDSLALYNRSAGSGSQYDCFFNSLQIVGP